MTLETLNTKFATLSEAYAARDADQAALAAAVVALNAQLAPALATYMAINTPARLAANIDGLGQAAGVSEQAAAAALADYAAAFDEFRSQ